MRNNLSKLAIAGNQSLFEQALPVGQINIPSWERFEKQVDAIFSRRYYTNHGVLAQELEEKLSHFFQTKHVILMTNATIALTLACKGLDLPLGGKVIVPAFTFAATVQALTWAGLEPVFCDVNTENHQIDTDSINSLFSIPGVCAILGVHLWGNACKINKILELAELHGVKVFYDAAHAVGCTYNGTPIGNFGSCEVFSFHGTKILSTTEGGCITTNDDLLAERLRNLRSSYGRRENVSIPIAGYGRFSEMQAAFGLLSLEDFPANCAANKARMELYAEELQTVPGIRMLFPTPGEKHNYQYVVMEIDEIAFGLNRDTLIQILEAENIIARRYFVPGMHRCVPYSTQFPQYVEALPITDMLCQKVMQLPSGQRVSLEDIQSICELIRFIHIHAKELKEYLRL